MYRELFTDEFRAKLEEIQRLIAEASQHSLDEDGHCKSSEGAISIDLPPFYWSWNDKARPRVQIYSYLLGPSRNHEFDDIDAALKAARRWHSEEMAADRKAGWYE